jgi:hypothetical protein
MNAIHTEKNCFDPESNGDDQKYRCPAITYAELEDEGILNFVQSIGNFKSTLLVQIYTEFYSLSNDVIITYRIM